MKRKAPDGIVSSSQRTKKILLDTDEPPVKDCLHDLALPPQYCIQNGSTRIEDVSLIKSFMFQRKSKVEEGILAPAKQFPFTLDPFQQEAVRAIELEESILVSAHTSAGKTACAEYAIAKSLNNGSRVIYTSPIKALSNQKFRELQEEFSDVGLMTGDVTINPNSSCLVMTTEILRSMLYRGSEILNEVKWVIFDEVHYMRDKERGVVWEETMILLPNSVRYIFLSATIPNSLEFASWIAKLKDQPVHVVYTDYRPTPLQHYVYPVGGDGIHLVVDKHSFKPDNWKKAIEELKKNSKPNSQNQSKKDKNKVDLSLVKLVNMVMKRNFQPVIVFSFSRRDCETRAVALSKSNFNDEEEQALVQEVFNNAIDSLSEDDKKLPQVENMLPLLQKGIGVHHSGLLPIMKEVIEILFQEGLIKILFATETFAMGLNMPARTVIFTGIEKFDGQLARNLTSGEYIQMSGRAGRRGLDDKGIVILMLEDGEMKEQDAKHLMNGIADPLNSSFHLSYYMVLNLLRVEEITPEYIMERSFLQFQNEKKKMALQTQLDKLIEQRDAITIENEAQVCSYFSLKEDLDHKIQQLQQLKTTPKYCLWILRGGRVIKTIECGWVIVLRVVPKSHVVKSKADHTNSNDYLLEVLCGENEDRNPFTLLDYHQQKDPVSLVKSIPLSSIKDISSVMLSNIPKLDKSNVWNVRNNSLILSLFKFISLHSKNLSDGEETFGILPLIDYVETMGIPKKVIDPINSSIENLTSRLSYSPYFKSHTKDPNFLLYNQKLELDQQVLSLKAQTKQWSGITMQTELKNMMRVLRRLGFVSEDNVITTKGRVGCELSSADSLVITELLYNGKLSNLSPEQLVSLMSCFCSESVSSKDEDIESLDNDLKDSYLTLQQTCKKIVAIFKESKIEVDEEKYLKSFPFNMMNITYAWCKGACFSEICKMATQFEGSIVRSMRRCEEIIRQTCAASKLIGEEEIEKKLIVGLEKLRKDIVFSSSLYL